MSQWLSGKRLALIGPPEGLGHRAIEILDKSQHFRLEISYRRKSSTLEQLTRQNTEPNLDLVEPGGMLGRIDKANTMIGVLQERLARLHRLEYAGLAFDTQVHRDLTFGSNPAHQGL